MMTVTLLLALAAFVCTIYAARGKCQLWIAVLLLCLIPLLSVLPR